MFDYGGEAAPNCIPSVLEVAASYPELTLVTALFQRAELTEIFTCPGPFTLLLPSNSAFDEIDPVFLEFLLRPENQEALEDLLLYHIIPGSFPTTELVAGELDTLLPGEVVTVDIDPVMFNDAAVLTPDIDACNGIIDIIDAVLLPFAPRKSRLLAHGSQSLLSQSYRTQPSHILIIFAASIPPVPGPTLAPVPMVSGPTTVPAPLPTIAPTSFCTVYDFGNPEKGEQGCTPNVLEEARSNPDLSLAVILFERAELADIFTCPGSFTVLFPTNSAIEMVDASLVEFLLQPENILELQNLMLYHVLPGYFPSPGLTNGQLIETLFPRRDVEVTVTPDTIMFNDATVVTPDIEACNGLIHTISQVLTFLPPRKFLRAMQLQRWTHGN